MIHITTIFEVLLLVLINQVTCQGPAKCLSPPPSSNFTLKGYYGVWYEIGKFQTPGGAFFEKDCVCTVIDVEPKYGGSSEGDSTALNSSRKNTYDGHYANATGQLIDKIQPGQWKEKFFFFAPAVNYTVIYMDDNFAVEYDCGESFGQVNYCIHILARTPTPDQDMVKHLAVWSLKLGLNNIDVPFLLTNQTKCW